jgi:DNA-binding transcriptional regulator YiaG
MTTQSTESKAPKTPKPVGRPRVHAKRETPASARLLATQTRLGLTDASMARYLGVPVSTWRNWACGHREPGAVTARLLDVLDAVECLAPDMHKHLLP